MLLPLQMLNLMSQQAAAFVGPDISNFSIALNQAMSARDFSTRFVASTAITFTLFAGTLPTGVTLSSAGVISGTPTVGGSFAGLVIRATDADTNTADSNAFTITVLSGSSGEIGGDNMGGDDIGGDDIGGGDINTPEWWLG